MIGHFGMPLPFLEMADHFQKLADLMTHMDDLKNTAHHYAYYPLYSDLSGGLGYPRHPLRNWGPKKHVALENIHTLLKGHWKF